MQDGLKKVVKSWQKKIGRENAISRLVLRGVSASTAEQLCTGRYKSNPREKLHDILVEELGKDGITLLAQGEAS